MLTNSCASPEVLARLLRDALPDEQTADVRAHLAGCPACQALLDNLSEKPALGRWAAACRCLPPQPADEPELAPLLARLQAAAPTEPYLGPGAFEPAATPLA